MTTSISDHPELCLDPDYDHLDYRSSRLRSPRQALLLLDSGAFALGEPLLRGPVLDPRDSDLTVAGKGEPIGERIRVSGRISGSDGRPIAGALVEIWQANSAGRYRHRADGHRAPLDPNFFGAGRCLTGSQGEFSFVTIKPGAYPWGNHPNAWRPAHIHFSVIGRSFVERLVTQMYFPGDPLLAFDPIFNAIRDAKGRSRLVADFDWETTEEGVHLGYRFDIVIGGHMATPMDNPR